MVGERELLAVSLGAARHAAVSHASAWLAVVCLVPALVACGSARYVPQRILDVGIAADPYPPFVTEDGGGFAVELAEKLAADLGYAGARWVPYEWPDLQAEMARGDYDLAASGVTWRVERAVVGYTSRAYAAGGPCVVGDAAGYRIAVNRGGVLEAWARERFEDRELELVTVDDNDELPGLLAAGEVAAFVTDSFEAAHFRRPEDPLECAPATDRKVLWLAPHAASLGPGVDAWLRESEPWLREQRRRHLGAAMPRDDLDHLLDLLARRLAVMPYVAAWKVEHGEPIEDPPREAAVIAAAQEAARSHGLDPDSVAALFRAQIELAKAVQRRSPPVAARLSLPDELRPLLTQLGERIVAALADVASIDAAALEEQSRWLALDPWLGGEPDREALRRALLGVRRATGGGSEKPKTAVGSPQSAMSTRSKVEESRRLAASPVRSRVIVVRR